MNLTLACLADAVNVSREGKLNVLGIFDVIFVQSFPAIQNCMQLILRLSENSIENGKTKQIYAALVDADGHVIYQIQTNVRLQIMLEGCSPAIQQIFTLIGVRFEKPGDYAFHIKVEGELVGTVPLKVLFMPIQQVPTS